MLFGSKRDSATDIMVDSKEMEVAPPAYSRDANHDITQPQLYDIKSTKMDWIYSGAYSLRLTGTEDEVWKTKIHYQSIEVFRADNTLVGTANLNCWSTKIKVSMNEAGAAGAGHGSHKEELPPQFTMTRNKGIFSDSKVFTIPETGETFTWKRTGKMSAKFEMLDSRGDVVAWIGPTSWKGRYKFELKRAGMDETMVEVVVVTALAMNENEKRNTLASTNAAASSGASAGAAAAAGA